MLQRMARARRASTRLAGWSVVVAFVLIGAALLLTVWTTRAAVEEASDAVRGGQAMTLAHAVRADLTGFDGLPTNDELAKLVEAHADEGLRYVAIFGGPERVLAEAGTPVGGPLMPPDHDALLRGPGPLPTLRGATLHGGRMRLVVPIGLMGVGPGAPGHPPRMRRMPLWHAMIEVEPVQADALRGAAQRSVGIGALAAASLLAVAIVLVRRESRRHADERERERQRRLASLGEMSAVLAHEIRNPLASLKGNAQLLAQMLPGGEKPRAKAERVVEEAARLEKLTSELLDFVRTGQLRRAAADPAQLVREAVAARAGDGGDGASSVENGIEIDAAEAPASWSLDADRLREVIVNLVDNARAAGPPVRVAVSVVRSSGARMLRIDVADRGPGVDGEDRERIFEPFVTGKTRGTGLGLAVARRVVEAHGGTLDVLDREPGNPGGGALFRLELPEA
jgi:two-component system, NtrC family, sensor histidine kinase HydH